MLPQPSAIFDRLIAELDHGLRTVASSAQAAKPSPAKAVADQPLSADEANQSARLMRVNHSGEIAAQALYRGQALVTKDPALREKLLQAAAEEQDHLAWCQDRVTELGQKTSLLSPVWYAGSFALGAGAGLAGDRLSLGFLAETERQVSEHLDGHLQRLPVEDARSRQVVAQMKQDEIAHGRQATALGAGPLGRPIRAAMRGTARIMTGLAYWI